MAFGGLESPAVCQSGAVVMMRLHDGFGAPDWQTYGDPGPAQGAETIPDRRRSRKGCNRIWSSRSIALPLASRATPHLNSTVTLETSSADVLRGRGGWLERDPGSRAAAAAGVSARASRRRAARRRCARSAHPGGPTRRRERSRCHPRRAMLAGSRCADTGTRRRPRQSTTTCPRALTPPYVADGATPSGIGGAIPVEASPRLGGYSGELYVRLAPPLVGGVDRGRPCRRRGSPRSRARSACRRSDAAERRRRWSRARTCSRASRSSPLPHEAAAGRGTGDVNIHLFLLSGSGRSRKSTVFRGSSRQYLAPLRFVQTCAIDMPRSRD